MRVTFLILQTFFYNNGLLLEILQFILGGFFLLNTLYVYLISTCIHRRIKLNSIIRRIVSLEISSYETSL